MNDTEKKVEVGNADLTEQNLERQRQSQQERQSASIASGGVPIRNTANEIRELRRLLEYAITQLAAAGDHNAAKEVREKLDKIKG